jgi:hypothetical protein
MKRNLAPASKQNLELFREPETTHTSGMLRTFAGSLFCLFLLRGEEATEKPPVPAREKEFQMALSAAPEHLRAKAGVYVLEENGFVLARPAENGFTCIVNRDHPRNLKPTCYDAEGTHTILPKVLRIGQLLRRGLPAQKIREEIAEGFRAGKYIAPRRPGVAYMLSGDIQSFNPHTGKAESFPPHVMFYAPNLTNEDIGSTGEFEPGLPSIGYQGPHGYMILVLGKH